MAYMSTHDMIISSHHPSRWMDGYVCMYVCMYVWMDGWMDGWQLCYIGQLALSMSMMSLALCDQS